MAFRVASRLGLFVLLVTALNALPLAGGHGGRDHRQHRRARLPGRRAARARAGRMRARPSVAPRWRPRRSRELMYPVPDRRGLLLAALLSAALWAGLVCGIQRLIG